MVTTNSSVVISQIYQSRKNVLELMDRQGFDVSGYANFSVSEINAMKQNNQLDMLLEKKETEKSLENKKVYIRYYLAKTIRPANLQEMIDEADRDGDGEVSEEEFFRIMKKSGLF